jgi:hypothetical protein
MTLLRRRRLVQHLDRAAAVGAFDGRQQVAGVGAGELAVEDQVGQHDAARLQRAARVAPEFARHQMAGDRGARAVDIDHDGIEAARGVDHEAPRIGGDEFAARRFAQEIALGDGADRRIDIDVGVAIQRLAVRQREAAGAQHQDVAFAEAQIVEQDAPQVLHVARIQAAARWRRSPTHSGC